MVASGTGTKRWMDRLSFVGERLGTTNVVLKNELDKYLLIFSSIPVVLLRGYSVV